MFELITDVPSELSQFYTEELRNELSGESIRVGYTYLDEEGNELTGTRMEPEYVENAYVVMLPKGQMVSWEKVEQIIEKHQGNKDAVVGKFIDLAVATDNWNFHADYINWLKKEPDGDAAKYLVIDEESTYFDQESLDADRQYWLESEPVMIAGDGGKLALIRNAKFKRDVGRYAPITVDGKTFDADQLAYENMKGTVDSWDTLVCDETLLAAGLVDGSTMLWTLEDNTVTSVTKEVLQSVLGAVSVRAGLLQAQYAGSKE